MGAPPGCGSASSDSVTLPFPLSTAEPLGHMQHVFKKCFLRFIRTGLSGLSSAGCVTLGKSPSLSEPRGPGPALHLW